MPEEVEYLDVTPDPDFLLGFRLAEDLVEKGHAEHVMDLAPALMMSLRRNMHWYLEERARQGKDG